jgi:hypothetical protein
MMDIFYKGSKGLKSSFGTVGSEGPLDLCSLEKYMLTHTFFDGFKKTKEPIYVEPIIPVLKPPTEPIKPVFTESIKPLYIEPIKPICVEPIKSVFVEPPKPPIETIKPPIIVEPIKPPTETIKPPIRTRFRSYLKDSLFWCMYVHSHGSAAFETTKAIGTNMLNLMMNEKRVLFDFFNKEENKTALKNINHKITNVKINEIKCDLMTKPMLSSIEALIPCCVYWNCPIYVDLGNKTFLHFVPNTYVSDDDEGIGDPNAVLLYVCEGRFELELDQEKKSQRIKEMCQGFYKIPHYEKPLLGIGTYKTDELQYLYDMVISASDIKCCAPHPTLLQSSKGAEHPTLLQSSKMKKQDLYAAIAQKCVLPTTMF